MSDIIVISGDKDGEELRQYKRQYPRHIIEDGKGQDQKFWKEAEVDSKRYSIPGSAWKRIFGGK